MFVKRTFGVLDYTISHEDKESFNKTCESQIEDAKLKLINLKKNLKNKVIYTFDELLNDLDRANATKSTLLAFVRIFGQSRESDEAIKLNEEIWRTVRVRIREMYFDDIRP